MLKTVISCVGSVALVAFMIWTLCDISYKDYNYVPNRVQIWGDSIFFTLPRYNTIPGQGFSLALATPEGFYPFPNRRCHNIGLITNAVDLKLDLNKKLWVLDSGFVQTLKKPHKKGDVRILAINALTSRVEEIIKLDDLVPGRAQFLSIEENRSGTRYLYISDGPARSIAVWDVKASKGHRVLLPERVMPKENTKVLYLALISTRLYFTYFGSPELFYIETSGLKKGGKVKIVGKKDKRMVFLGSVGYDIIFRLAGRPEILAWDTRGPLDRKQIDIIDRGNNKTSPMAAVANYGTVWILESDIKSFLEGKQPENIFRPVNSTDFKSNQI